MERKVKVRNRLVDLIPKKRVKISDRAPSYTIEREEKIVRPNNLRVEEYQFGHYIENYLDIDFNEKAYCISCILKSAIKL